MSHTYAATGPHCAQVRIIPTEPDDDDLPTKIDFSPGRRGQFYQPQTHLNLPVYLEAEVETYLAARAKAKGIDIGQLVNELLKKDIEFMEAAQ